MPENYIAFEYPMINPQWWFEITEGLPNPIVKNGVIEVWYKSEIGVDFIVEAFRNYLSEEGRIFFDWRTFYNVFCFNIYANCYTN